MGHGGGGGVIGLRVSGETDLITRTEQPVGSSSRGDIGDIGVGDVDERLENVSHSDVKSAKGEGIVCSFSHTRRAARS